MKQVQYSLTACHSRVSALAETPADAADAAGSEGKKDVYTQCDK